MVLGSRRVSLGDTGRIEELPGKLSSDMELKGFLHSVLESKNQRVEDGKLIADAINQGLSAFSPSELFEMMIKNYALAESIYGKSLIRRLFQYDPGYIRRNISIPEFQKILKSRLTERIESLKDESLLSGENELTEKALELATVVMYFDEIDHLVPKGFFGEKEHKEHHIYGLRDDVKPYKHERYRDIAIKRSLRKVIRRGHTELALEDLMSFERVARGESFIVYAIDASGSMRGRKIEQSKKAGIALAYKAIDSGDKVGLVIFGKNIRSSISVTDNFTVLLREIVKAKPLNETNIVAAISEAGSLFPEGNATRHLIIITDAMPTVGKNPELETLEAVGEARARGITISIVGIELRQEGLLLAEKIAKQGEGRLYIVKNLDEIDKIVLEDYYATRAGME